MRIMLTIVLVFLAAWLAARLWIFATAARRGIKHTPSARDHTSSFDFADSSCSADAPASSADCGSSSDGGGGGGDCS